MKTVPRMLNPPFSDDPIIVDIDPLIRAIAQGNAVVFVGAGLSQASGLPSWEQLLKVCLAKAEEHSTNPDEWAKTRQSLDQSNYLMVAELLHKGLGPARLGDYLAEAIGAHSRPSRIHRAVGRIPFSLAVTTNYDNLLEHVVHPPPSAIFTWQETVGIFTAINTSKEKFLNNLVSSGEFGQEPLGRDRPSFPIIKSHGDLAKPDTIVLTRSQYRDLAHQNKAFNECMKALLTYRTVLFVGCSLTDPDTLALMDEIRMIHGTTSLHYAIVSNSMVDSHYESFLRESFNIHTIVYDANVYTSAAERKKSAQGSKSAATAVVSKAPLQAESGDSSTVGPPSETHQHIRKQASSDDIRKEDHRTTAVFEILKCISGRAALAIHSRANVLKFGHPLFNQLDACKLLLTHACEVTGTDYGDICMVTSPHSRKLARVCSYPSPTGEQDPHWNNIPHNSIIGSLFVQRRLTEDYIYIPNVAHADAYLQYYGHLEVRPPSAEPQLDRHQKKPVGEEKESEDQEYDDDDYDPAATHYHPCHRDVRSELACPILADGECVGVLNLESTIEDAYTRAHLQVVRSIATEIGAAYIAARRRIDASSGLDACLYPKNQENSKGETGQNKDCGDLHRLVKQDPLVRRERIHFLLWERDCVNGRVKPYYCACDDETDAAATSGTCSVETREEVRTFRYKFSDPSLVVSCLRDRRRLAVRDADLALKSAAKSQQPPLLNRRGVEVFAITGPVIAHPIRSRGHMAAVLVAWSKHGRYIAPPEVTGQELTQEERANDIRSCAPVLRATERVHRILDVLANIPLTGGINDQPYAREDVYDYVEALLTVGPKCQEDKPKELVTAQHIQELLDFLVNPPVRAPKSPMDSPFGRIRLWLQSPDGDYRCVAASHAHGYQHCSPASILNTPSSPEDLYFRYTQRRAPTDPYARLQYPAIFGNEPDDNFRALGKDKAGCWIVGPIVSLRVDPAQDTLNPFGEIYTMHGFLSVDSHRLEGTAGVKDQIKPHKHEQLLRFQRRIVDLATSLLAELCPAKSETATDLLTAAATVAAATRDKKTASAPN